MARKGIKTINREGAKECKERQEMRRQYVNHERRERARKGIKTINREGAKECKERQECGGNTLTTKDAKGHEKE